MRNFMALTTLSVSLYGCVSVYLEEPPSADVLGAVPATLGGYWRNVLDTDPVVYEVKPGSDGKIATIDPKSPEGSKLYRQEVSLRCGRIGHRNICVAGPGNGVTNVLPKTPVLTPESARWAAAAWTEHEDGVVQVEILSAHKIAKIYGDTAVEKLANRVHAVRLSEEVLTKAIASEAVFESDIYRYRRLPEEHDPEVSVEPARAVSRIEELRRQLRHPNDKMRYAAALEIAKMGVGATPAVADLVEIIDDFNRLWPDSTDRTPYAAARALAAIGDGNQTVVDVLRQMRDGPGADDPEARGISEEALESISD